MDTSNPLHFRRFFQPRGIFSGLLLAALGLSLVAPAVAATIVPARRFEVLRAQDLRVASVAYRLSVANEAFCREMLVPQAGFVLHSLEQYGPADREGAARSFAMGPGLNVMAVVAGSPAAVAGLTADDQLMSINGRKLSMRAIAPNQAASRVSVKRAEQIIGEELNKGEVALRLFNARGDREIRFQAATGCSADVELVPGAGVNAWADGNRVVVSTGLLKQSRTDDDLALVIAHEMAHNLLHHRHRLGSAKSQFLPSAVTGAMMRQTEEEADKLAVRLVAAAAFDLKGAESFLTGLMGATPATGMANTHPQLDRRLALLRLEIAALVG